MNRLDTAKAAYTAAKAARSAALRANDVAAFEAADIRLDAANLALCAAFNQDRTAPDAAEYAAAAQLAAQALDDA